MRSEKQPVQRQSLTIASFAMLCVSLSPHRVRRRKGRGLQRFRLLRSTR